MEKTEVLGKHKKYKDKYGEKELFWGFGIELETYFQFTKPVYVATPILRSARKAERYSVGYYNSYKPETLKQLDTIFPDASGCVPLPLFFNGHSFTRVDRNGNHETTYSKNPVRNPKYTKSFFKELQEWHPDFFEDEHEVGFTFDGDTIEFITQDFYCAKISSSIKELVDFKNTFLTNVNEYITEKKLFRDKGLLMYPPVNPPLAVFHTNPQNIAMFNNGTYHINITLPSVLGPKRYGLPSLENPELFKQQHRGCIRVYQWLEPLLIGMYGTPDLFRTCSGSSQRCAMSRYIGVGTYNTHDMPEGKILTAPVETLRGSQNSFWWYKAYHSKSGYIPLTQIGMDINYKKHYLHGIELRIFDWFPETFLEEVCSMLIYAAEASLLHTNVLEPAMSRTWNGIVVKVLRQGKSTVFTNKEIGILESIFLVGFPKNCRKLPDVYKRLFRLLKKKFAGGAISKAFLGSSGCLNIFS